jgi:GTP-binding protein
LGVIVSNGDGAIGEIIKHEQKLLIAKGGKGGRGNACFVSSTHRSPRQREEGISGDKKTIKLVLKLISDIGLVGLPNSGKSTLLHALTNAHPRIGSYPFTTLSPNLGVLRNDVKPTVIADMPGIVEGAHRGKGLGHHFLRHIERTRLLVIVIDCSVPDPLAHYHCIINEFMNYNKGLPEKKRVVAFNKIDLLPHPPHHALSERTFYISALKSVGIKELATFLYS